jgi:hypothetical protein
MAPWCICLPREEQRCVGAGNDTSFLRCLQVCMRVCVYVWYVCMCVYVWYVCGCGYKYGYGICAYNADSIEIHARRWITYPLAFFVRTWRRPGSQPRQYRNERSLHPTCSVGLDSPLCGCLLVSPFYSYHDHSHHLNPQVDL